MVNNFSAFRLILLTYHIVLLMAQSCEFGSGGTIMMLEQMGYCHRIMK